MNSWFNRWNAKRRCIRSKRKAVRLLQEFMKENWDNPTSYDEIREALKERTWVMGDFKLVHSRMIRGDLVEFWLGDEKIADWMDDRHQWGLFGSIRDIVVHTYHLQVKQAITLFNPEQLALRTIK